MSNKTLLFINTIDPAGRKQCLDELFYDFRSVFRKSHTKACDQRFESSGTPAPPPFMFGAIQEDGTFKEGAFRSRTECCNRPGGDFDMPLPHGYCAYALADHILEWHRDQIPRRSSPR